MRPWCTAGRALASAAVTVLLVVLAPAVLLFGELVNRHYLSPRRSHRRIRLVGRVLLMNPIWIALTAPGRWLYGRLRPYAGHRRGRGGNGPPGAGVREPRRPMPDLPAGAMALPEPR